MITINNLTKQFGADVLFENVNFSINPGERLGLIGRNGHGKSTLFNILAGGVDLDEGSISFPKNYTFGYLTQHIDFTESTVLKEASLGLKPDDKFDHWKVEKILSGLGFSDEDFNKHPDLFSGGYQVRINLAKVLVAEPNLLLLDEPTNFLDIISIRWLEKFLKAWPNEIMIISHDRSFIDRVSTHILGIHRKKVRKIKGKTSKFFEQIRVEEEVHEKERLNLEKKQLKMEEFIAKFGAKAGTASLVQSRVKTLEKMKKPEKLDSISSLNFAFSYAHLESKVPLRVTDLSFSYKDKPSIIKNFNMEVKKNDKICIVGKNGKGKSTLIKLLAGKLTADEGEIRYHPRAKKGFFEQLNTVSLNDKNTIESELLDEDPTGNRTKVRGVCGAMMFSGDDALKSISVLSGGEKCRVLLGKLLMSPLNIILLDEPSHHLDLESTEGITDALIKFEGPVVVVTHNEDMLERIATKLIVFKDDGPFVFEGKYKDFLREVKWDDDDEALKEKPKEKRLSKKELRKLKAKKLQTLEPLKKKIKELEKNIEESEKYLELENKALIEASTNNDYEKIAIISKSVKLVEKKNSDLYEKLETLMNEYEKGKSL